MSDVVGWIILAIFIAAFIAGPFLGHWLEKKRIRLEDQLKREREKIRAEINRKAQAANRSYLAEKKRLAEYERETIQEMYDRAEEMRDDLPGDEWKH